MLFLILHGPHLAAEDLPLSGRLFRSAETRAQLTFATADMTDTMLLHASPPTVSTFYAERSMWTNMAELFLSVFKTVQRRATT